MPPFHSYLSVAWCVIAGLACATGTDFKKGNPAPPSRVITHDEIVDTRSAGNAYQAVFLLRPDWFRPRGQSLLNPVIMPVVFVDNMRHGPMESLAQIRIGDVEEIHYFSPSAATTKWGTGVMGGAIEVVRFPHPEADEQPLARVDVGLEGAFVLSDCIESYRRSFPQRLAVDPPVLFTELRTDRPERIEGPDLAYPESQVFAGRMSGWANFAFVVEPDGKVVDGALISAADRAFAVEASVWLTESAWKPGMIGGAKVPTLMCERFDFRVGR